MKLKIFGVFIAAVLIELVIFLFSLGKTNTEIITTPSPLPLPASSNNVGIDSTYNESARKLLPEIKNSDKKANAVGGLLDLLPHTESLFSLSYDFDKNQFTAIVSASNKDAGLGALDTFLKNNGVDDRSWIKNLIISYQ